MKDDDFKDQMTAPCNSCPVFTLAKVQGWDFICPPERILQAKEVGKSCVIAWLPTFLRLNKK